MLVNLCLSGLERMTVIAKNKILRVSFGKKVKADWERKKIIQFS